MKFSEANIQLGFHFGVLSAWLDSQEPPQTVVDAFEYIASCFNEDEPEEEAVEQDDAEEETESGDAPDEQEEATKEQKAELVAVGRTATRWTAEEDQLIREKLVDGVTSPTQIHEYLSEYSDIPRTVGSVTMRIRKIQEDIENG